MQGTAEANKVRKDPWQLSVAGAGKASWTRGACEQHLKGAERDRKRGWESETEVWDPK